MRKKILPCAVHVSDAYGVKDLYVGVPCVIGSKGVEEVLDLELTSEEKASFEQSASAVRALIEDLNRLDV